MKSCKKHKCTELQIKQYCKRPTKKINKMNCTRKNCFRLSKPQCEKKCNRDIKTYDFSKWPIRGFRRRRLDCLAGIV
jgi:hypothetical protein